MQLNERIHEAHKMCAMRYSESQRFDKLLEEAFELCAALMQSKNKSMFDNRELRDQLLGEVVDVYIVISEILDNRVDGQVLHKLMSKKYDKFMNSMIEEHKVFD